jgi:GxxExxY protein
MASHQHEKGLEEDFCIRAVKRNSTRGNGDNGENRFEISVALVEHHMHPLFERASALTETIIAAAIEVHRDKGPGLIESIYEWCLIKELGLRSVNCVSQKVVVVEYKGFTREEPLRFDLLVDGCVLVEAKAVEKILPIHKAQLLSYMKLLNVPSGCSLTSMK